MTTLARAVASGHAPQMRRMLVGIAASTGAISACRDHAAPTGEIAVPHPYAVPAQNLDVAWRGPKADRVPAPGPAIAIRQGEPPWLEGVDTVAHRTLWRVACNDVIDASPCIGKLERRGDIVVYGGTLAYRAPDWSVGLFAVDVRTGRELWRIRTDFEDAQTLKLASDADHVYALCWSHLVAFDLATGKRAWERRLAPREMSPSRGTQLVAGDGVVAFWDSSQAIHLADPRTGADRATLPWQHFVGDMAIRDGVLYAIPMWGSEPEMVAAYAVATGRMLWRHDEAELAVPPMFVDGDSIYFRRATDTVLAGNDAGTELVALDRATGAVSWRRALGVVERFSAVVTGDGPATLVAELDAEAMVFARQPQVAQPHWVAVSGTVRLDGLTGDVGGLGVRVGDVVARTAADGSFVVQVSGLGAVAVALLDQPHLTHQPSEPVVADAAPVTVDRLADHYRTEIVVHPLTPWPPD